MSSPLISALPQISSRSFDLNPRVVQPEIIVGVLYGEGIGREIVDVALDVLKVTASLENRSVDIRLGGPIGKEAVQSHGQSLTAEVESFCEDIFKENGALFCGPGGARFVYNLRARFDLFCKFTPLSPLPSLEDVTILRPHRLKGADIVLIRENIAGLYFGEGEIMPTASGDRVARIQISYASSQIARIIKVAATLASSRRKRVCVVVKQEAVAAISELWIEEALKFRELYPDIDWEILDIDNALYQMIADPQRFDVIVSSNMYGDVLADCGALLLGSRGLSYSGNFTEDGKGVYQTGHGAAYDLAGKDIANPLGQIISLAMMLRESFDWAEGAKKIHHALDHVLKNKIRTADIAAVGHQVVGTRALGEAVCEAILTGAST